MVISQLLGGMGNQMFQYALGRNLSLINKAELKLDTSILLDWRAGRHAVNRGFDLDIFKLNPEIAMTSDFGRFHTTSMPLPEKIVYKAKQLVTGRKNITVEKYFHFDPHVLDLNGDVYLSGTWQSYKYFNPNADVIRRDFEFIDPISEQAMVMVNRIRSVKSVCLNVRRTDYVSVAVTADAMSAVSLRYYEDALHLMKEWIGDFEVFVFSDDIEWCKSNLKFVDYAFSFVEHRYAGKKFKDYLQLMKLCDHYIIPNSTFAWWGAWLNQNSSKRVIAPKDWFKDSTIVTEDLIPESWVRL